MNSTQHAVPHISGLNSEYISNNALHDCTMHVPHVQLTLSLNLSISLSLHPETIELNIRECVAFSNEETLTFREIVELRFVLPTNRMQIQNYQFGWKWLHKSEFNSIECSMALCSTNIKFEYFLLHQLTFQISIQLMAGRWTWKVNGLSVLPQFHQFEKCIRRIRFD